MDLKIEIRNLLALHEATLQLEHGVREVLKPDQWRTFAPSRFVYAFFTFNGIYAYDWSNSFQTTKAVRWEEDDKHPSEDDQIKSYLRVATEVLGDDAPRLFRSALVSALPDSIPDPAVELRQVRLVNPDRKTKELARQLPRHVEQLHRGKVRVADLYPTLCSVLRFVYRVRCNLFHGAKTQVRLHDAAQQRRLEVYTAILIASNGLLFDMALRADIGWRNVEVSFRRHAAEPVAAADAGPHIQQ